MASAGDGAGSLPPNFFLTPHQQSLLFAALNANQQQPSGSAQANPALSLPPNALHDPSLQSLDASSTGDGPLLDSFDYDLTNQNFDFSFASADQSHTANDDSALARSDSSENESNEKRSHPDDEEEDGTSADPKRHEGSDKAPKKAGRKLLTSEPTTKRKAQNRAAQRAFRERKEKHVKDLEVKVQELEQASQAATHENSKLRGQVDRITAELNQYKQKLALMTSTNKAITKDKVPFGSAGLNNLNDVNFHFEFPKFGALPGSSTNGDSTPSPQPISPHQNGQANNLARAQRADSRASSSAYAPAAQDDLTRFSGMYTPSMSSLHHAGSKGSLDSTSASVGNATRSPSASSNSINGPSSSCGTSPESSNQSPMGFKPLETLTTIGEEQPAVTAQEQHLGQLAPVDLSSSDFDWLAHQNGGSFDPQLFGDYREPQDNILSNPVFDDLFNDTFNADFYTPYNMGPTPPATIKPAHTKTLIEEIDAKQKALDDDVPPAQNMNCNQIWDKLQGCPKAQSGEIDLDGLCSELTKKAKCSGHGPVVAEKDFDTILKRYMGKDVSTECVASKLGISVSHDKPNGVAMP